MSVSSAWRYSELASSTPGEEGAQRHRDAGERHELRDADHQQQRERGEELAQVGARDDAQRRAREVAAEDDHAGDRGDREPGTRIHSRLRRRAVSTRREQRHQRDQRDRRDVLEEEDAERGASRWACRARCARSSPGSRSPWTRAPARGPPTSAACHGEAEREEGERQYGAAHGELQRAAAEDRRAHRPQALRVRARGRSRRASAPRRTRRSAASSRRRR